MRTSRLGNQTHLPKLVAVPLDLFLRDFLGEVAQNAAPNTVQHVEQIFR